MAHTLTNATARIRFNWGYWDGRFDQERGQWPKWARPHQSSGHPFDRIYGQGYWAGRYDQNGAETSDDAWKHRNNRNT